MSEELRNLKQGEQLFVHGRLVTNASRLGYETRVATDLFLADSPTSLEPAGHAQSVSTWKGHLSKRNALNRLPEEGAASSEKFGVMRILKTATKPLYVNLVADSAAPFEPNPATGDRLPVGAGSFIDVIRYPANRNG